MRLAPQKKGDIIISLREHSSPSHREDDPRHLASSWRCCSKPARKPMLVVLPGKLTLASHSDPSQLCVHTRHSSLLGLFSILPSTKLIVRLDVYNLEKLQQNFISLSLIPSLSNIGTRLRLPPHLAQGINVEYRSAHREKYLYAPISSLYRLYW